MIGMKAMVWLAGISLALAVLFGFGYCTEREARKRATHDATADSLARNTQQSAELLAAANTVYVRTDRHYSTVRMRVDTVTLSGEVREIIRSCDALQVSCAARSRASDSVIRDLRAELEHAKDPPPGKRLSYFAEGGYSVLDKGAVVGVGAAVRLAGTVSLIGKVEGASERSVWKEPETRALVGVRITF